MRHHVLSVFFCAVFTVITLLPLTVLADTPTSIVKGSGNDTIPIELESYTIDGGGGEDTLVVPLFPNAYTFTETGSSQYTAQFLEFTADIERVEYVQFGGDFTTKLPIEDLASGSAQKKLEELTDLYLAYFGRAPDVIGLEYWQSQYLTGKQSFEEITVNFAWSQEAQALYPQGGSNKSFVQTVYQNCFSRDPDYAGWYYWTYILSGGDPGTKDWDAVDWPSLTVTDVESVDVGETDISDRGMFIGDVLLGAYAPSSGEEDRNLLTNKHEVALHYVNKLSEQPGEGFDESINDLLVLLTEETDTQEKGKNLLDYVFDEPVSLSGLLDDDVLFNLVWNNVQHVDADSDGYSESEGDCDDSNEMIYPGATEICFDGIDQDCDDIIDNCLPSTLVFETTLGVDGGNIGDDTFNLEVSPGSFSGDTVLRVYNDTQSHPLGTPGALYQVQGIPSDYTGTLSVRMKSSETNEDSFIIVGEQVFASSLAGLTEGYHMLERSRDGDYLVVEIPASGANDPAVLQAQLSRSVTAVSNDQQETQLSFGIFTVKTLNSSQGHFRIIYPAGVEDKAIALAVYLENAYSTFSSMGFSYADRTRWPVDVTLGPMADEGSYNHSLFGNNYGTIKIDSQLPVNNLQTTAGHEFFHLVQYLYDPRSIASKVWGSPSHYWFNEATATWAEEKFAAAGYVPPNMEINRMAPFDGMHKEAAGSLTAEDVADHGYGMASLIKYIALTYGEHTIRDIYLAISADSSFDLVSEIEKRLDPIDYNVTALTWWWKYLRGLVFGDVYSGLFDPSFLSSYVHEEWTPAMSWSAPYEDGPLRLVASKNFTRDFADYSGALYVVNITGNNFTWRSYLNATLLAPIAKGEGMEFYRFKPKSKIDLNAWLTMTSCWPGFACDRSLDYQLEDLEAAGESILVLVIKSKTNPPSTESVSRTLHMEFWEGGYWDCGATPPPPACYQ